jgi:hypothetical protein
MRQRGDRRWCAVSAVQVTELAEATPLEWVQAPGDHWVIRQQDEIVDEQP